MTKLDVKRAAKPSRVSLDEMAAKLTDLRVNSARVYAALAPNLGVDPELDIAEAEYRAAVDDFVREN